MLLHEADFVCKKIIKKFRGVQYELIFNMRPRKTLLLAFPAN